VRCPDIRVSFGTRTFAGLTEENHSPIFRHVRDTGAVEPRKLLFATLAGRQAEDAAAPGAALEQQTSVGTAILKKQVGRPIPENAFVSRQVDRVKSTIGCLLRRHEKELPAGTRPCDVGDPSPAR